MAGTLDGGLERERSLAGEFHEDEQRMLDQRQARRSLEVGLRFLVPGVRSVVGRDDVDDARGHGGADGVTVSGGLDGRVALDLVAEAGVVGVREPQVVHAGFGGQALALERRGAEERELLGGGDVQDVQTRVVAAGQLGGQRGGGVAGLDIAEARVFGGRDVFAPLGLGGGFGGLDARGVLAVRQDDRGRVTEDAFEGSHLVDEHVARRGAHEDLHPAHVTRVDALDGFDVGVRGAEEEGVVGD